MEILAKDNRGKITEWEEVPSEDLWEDGEIPRHEVISKIVKMVLDIGEWKLIREVE